MSAGCQPLRPDFLGRPLNICQPPVQSIALFDVLTMGWVVLHAEHTHIVFVPETLPLPDRRRPGEPGCWPRGDATHGAIQQIRSWCVKTWLLLVLHMWKTQLWKKRSSAKDSRDSILYITRISMHNKPHLHFQMTKHSQFLNVTSQDSFVPALGIDVSFPYANHRFISAIIGAIKWGGGSLGKN